MVSEWMLDPSITYDQNQSSLNFNPDVPLRQERGGGPERRLQDREVVAVAFCAGAGRMR